MIFNIDGTGNQVASMTFGPKKVIVVYGINKVVKDIDAAQKKVREYKPTRTDMTVFLVGEHLGF